MPVLSDVPFATLSPADRLARFRDIIAGRLVFTTSLGLEDQVITHWIAMQRLDIEIVTLDTGRLFPETHDLWAETEQRYGLAIRAIAPEADAIRRLLADQGANGFRHSVENRKACCHVRKVEPLNRALAGAAGWITGLRADQSGARATLPVIENEPSRGLTKLNPLIDWTREQVLAFAIEQEVPLNPLHAKGFLSIGCQPCTRAVLPGESERAGRWWWEAEAAGQKECGLHVDSKEHVARTIRTVEATP